MLVEKRALARERGESSRARAVLQMTAHMTFIWGLRIEGGGGDNGEGVGLIPKPHASGQLRCRCVSLNATEGSYL